MPNPLTPDQNQEVRRELAAGHLIQAIVLYRGFTGSGLADAKATVEAIRDGRAGQPTGGGTTTSGSASDGGPAPAGLGDWRTEAERLVFGGKKIQAIKLIRENTGLGLKEALDLAEAVRAGTGPWPTIGGARPGGPPVPTATRGVFDQPAPPAAAASPPSLDAARREIERLLVGGNKIEAIRALRAATGLGLKESKDAAEAIEAELRRDHPHRFQAADLQKTGGCLGAVLLLLAVATATVGVAATTALAAPAPAPAAVAPSAPTTSTAPAGEFLPGVRRILFLGDSITYAGHYVDDVETALRLRFPGRQFEVVNCGLPSETVSGLSEAGHAGGKFPRPSLHERLDRVLAKVKPDLVIACYGMNDGIYLPPADDRMAAFRAGMTRLHEKAEAAGAKIVHLTPPVFDPLPIRAKVAPAGRADADHPFAGYDGVLAAYADWLLGQRAKGWRVIDVHGPMTAALGERRRAEPAFTFSKDGVHPDAAGHRVMADALLRGLNLDPAAAAGAKRFREPGDPASVHARVRALVRERGRVLTDAWLTETGHARPGMKAGRPITEAAERAAEIERRIDELVRP